MLYQFPEMCHPPPFLVQTSMLSKSYPLKAFKDSQHVDISTCLSSLDITPSKIPFLSCLLSSRNPP